MSVDQVSSQEKIVMEVLKMELCNHESDLNWMRRPLRQSQEHYAALNASSLLAVIGTVEANMRTDWSANLWRNSVIYVNSDTPWCATEDPKGFASLTSTEFSQPNSPPPQPPRENPECTQYC